MKVTTFPGDTTINSSYPMHCMGAKVLVGVFLALMMVAQTVYACSEMGRLRRAEHVFFMREGDTVCDLSQGAPWGKMTLRQDSFVFNGHRLEGDYTLIRYNGTIEDNIVYFPYRRAVDYQANRNDTDYSFELFVDTEALIGEGKMATDCSDMVFMAGGELVPGAVVGGCNTNLTKVAVSIPALSPGAGQLYMFYGAGVNFLLWNLTEIYLLYDDFNDDMVGYQWNSHNVIDYTVGHPNCTIYEEGGYLHMENLHWQSPSDAKECGFRSVEGYGPGVVVEFRASLPGYQYNPVAAKNWLGLFDSPWANTSGKTAIIMQEDYKPYRRTIWSQSSSGYDRTYPLAVSDNFQEFKVEFFPGEVNYYVDGVSRANHTYVGDVGHFGGWSTWFTNYANGEDSDTRVDWVVIRKSGAIDSYTIGDEELGSYEVEHPYITSTIESIVCLASGTANPGDNLHLAGGLLDGGDFILVPSSDVDCEAQEMVVWNPSEYLFGQDLTPRFRHMRGVISRMRIKAEFCEKHPDHKKCEMTQWMDDFCGEDP